MNQIPNIEETHNTRESAKKVLREYYGYKSEQDVPDGLAAVLEDWLHHQLQKAREERDAVEKAYQAGISKIADELQSAGLVKTADLIRRDLVRLEANPTVENVMNDDHSELDQDKQ